MSNLSNEDRNYIAHFTKEWAIKTLGNEGHDSGVVVIYLPEHGPSYDRIDKVIPLTDGSMIPFNERLTEFVEDTALWGRSFVVIVTVFHNPMYHALAESSIQQALDNHCNMQEYHDDYSIVLNGQFMASNYEEKEE